MDGQALGGILELSDLHKSFGGVAAVDGMSLTVARGRITGLIGPNGAGKSTLFNLASGVIRADRGRVVLAGEDVSGLRPWRIARKGMVRTFQLAREMQRLTVLENLMLAPGGQSGEHLFNVFFAPARVRADEERVYARALEVLETVKLAAVMDEYAGNLSGGQKKLLELARALMVEPALILLDEPGAGVNPALMELLMATIARLNRDEGKTFLIVEHDMDLVARLCDHVVVMAEGRLLVEGPFDEVTRDARVMDAYLGGMA